MPWLNAHPPCEVRSGFGGPSRPPGAGLRVCDIPRRISGEILAGSDPDTASRVGRWSRGPNVDGPPNLTGVSRNGDPAGVEGCGPAPSRNSPPEVLRALRSPREGVRTRDPAQSGEHRSQGLPHQRNSQAARRPIASAPPGIPPLALSPMSSAHLLSAPVRLAGFGFFGSCPLCPPLSAPVRLTGCERPWFPKPQVAGSNPAGIAFVTRHNTNTCHASSFATTTCERRTSTGSRSENALIVAMVSG